MRDLQPSELTSLRGQLLVAHPNLREPNFAESIVLLSAHSIEDGALGIIVNRPTGRVLGDLKEDFRDHALSQLPVYHGGPVSGNELLLAAWRWLEEEGMFQLFFGVSAEKMMELQDTVPDLEARAFAGYAGWDGGQLEGELHEKSWIIAPLRKDYLGSENTWTWRKILTEENPDVWGFLKDMPEDPSWN